MEKPALILLVFLTFHLLGVRSALNEGWWSIDCGSIHSRVVNDSILWEPDTNFTKAGSNMRIQLPRGPEEMNTLRFFPNRTENNCYIIPLQFPGYNYIVRAGFYYGNYDGLSRPPTFDLKLDNENWTTVNTSWSVNGGPPVFQEAIYLTRSGNLSVCLVQSRNGEVPFISSLEGVPIRESLYEEVLETSTATLHLVSRTNFGGPEVRDRHNRVWRPGVTPANCHINTSIMQDYFLDLENYPPREVMLDVIESNNASVPITLTINLPFQIVSLPTYFAFYFLDIEDYSSNQTRLRTIHIYINGQEKSVINLGYGSSEAIIIYPLDITGPTINITLATQNKSSLPPMINAMEIFTRYDEAGPATPIGPYPSDTYKPSFSATLLIVIHVICLTTFVL